MKRKFQPSSAVIRVGRAFFEAHPVVVKDPDGSSRRFTNPLTAAETARRLGGEMYIGLRHAPQHLVTRLAAVASDTLHFSDRLEVADRILSEAA